MVPLPQVLLDDLGTCFSLEQLICHWKKMQHYVVKLVSMAEQIQAQFKPHPIVTLVIGKLDKCDDLLQRLKLPVSPCLVLAIGYSVHQLLKFSYACVTNDNATECLYRAKYSEEPCINFNT